MEEKLLKREHFIVTLAEKLAEYQARDRQAQPVSSFSGAQSLPVVVSRAAGEPEPPEGKSGTTQTQESIDVSKMFYASLYLLTCVASFY